MEQAREPIIITLQKEAADSWWMLRWLLYAIIYVLIMAALWTQYRKSKKLENIENERDLNALHLREQKEEARREDQEENLKVIEIKIDTLKKRDLKIRAELSERKREYEAEKKDIDRIRSWSAFWDVVNSGGNVSTPDTSQDSGQTEYPVGSLHSGRSKEDSKV